MDNDLQKPFGTYALRPRHQQLLRWAQGMPASWIGRRAALILRKVVLQQGHTIVDAVADDLKWRLYMDDNVSERKFLFLPQFFDRAERLLLKETLKDGDVFIDIGANAGIYTLTAAARVGDQGHVVSVEPNPFVLDRLKFNVALNGFEHRVMFEQSGVSDEEGFFDLTLDRTNLGGSSLVHARSDQSIRVRCGTLLSIVQKYQLKKITAIKADIEGAEDRALVPFFETAPKDLYPKIVIVENSGGSWKKDLAATLLQAGYRQKQITRMNQIWIRGQ